jgi:glucuronosyltransferase
MLGIPLFGEQSWNCAKMEHKRLGLCLELQELTTSDLYNSVQELINNGVYRNNVKRLSAIWLDQPMIGSQKASFWINHVIKFGGDHLRSPSVDQHLYQFLMFDVIGFFFIILLGFVLFVIGVFAVIRRCLILD